MFAIKVTDENLGKILNEFHSAPECPPFYPELYLKNDYNWYYISGYISRQGTMLGYAVLPENTLRHNFHVDMLKIQTDWDQIVRK